MRQTVRDFWDACEKCDIETIKKLYFVIENLDTSGFEIGYHTKYQMGRAVENGNLNVIKCLRGCGGDIEDTLLITAARNNNVDIVDYLLLNNVNIQCVASHGKTALHIAAANGNVDIVKKLLETQKCDVNKPDDDDETPLFYAVRSDVIEIVDLLITYGADYYHLNSIGNNLLHLAASKKNRELVERILFLGLDITHKNQDGKDPLYYAYASENTVNIELLSTTY